jgi:tRNA pseudouridine synthase 10
MMTRFAYISTFAPSTGKPKVVVLDFVTQAGTYVKELVHGEFGRTEPSISSIIGMEIDIVALDVMNIDLNFPQSLNR